MAEQVSGLVTWIAQGLKRGEQCFCVQHPHTSAAILKMLTKLGLDVRKEVERKALVICGMAETYLPSGKFDPTDMADLLKDSVNKAKESGFNGFRATGDMSWALESKPGSHLLLPYEQVMEKFYSEHPALGMCQYHSKQFPPDTLQATMRAHGTTFLQDEHMPNHYRVRLRKKDLFVDILKAKGANVLYHYIVQRDDSPEIIAWGQTSELSTAKKQATAALEQHPA